MIIIIFNIGMIAFIDRKVTNSAYSVVYTSDIVKQVQLFLYSGYNLTLLIILLFWGILRAPLLVSKQRNSEFQQLRQKLAAQGNLAEEYYAASKILKRSYLNLSPVERNVIFSLYSLLDSYRQPINSFQVFVSNLGLIIRDGEFKFIQLLLFCGVFGIGNLTTLILQAIPVLAIIVR